MMSLFLSTPSGWRATRRRGLKYVAVPISIHALRVEGDDIIRVKYWYRVNFYPRPPGGGRLLLRLDMRGDNRISIHALRVEGDILGILASRSHVISIHALRGEGDTAPRAFTTHCPPISIHALRVEGDSARELSRPLYRDISIHALRVEGDRPHPSGGHCSPVSIHALRVEGDADGYGAGCDARRFYPRPPGGGRPARCNQSSWSSSISIHALRVEGDIRLLQNDPSPTLFLSTPSGWRATSCTRSKRRFLIFLSTPSGWRATSLLVIVYPPSSHFYPRPPGGGRLYPLDCQDTDARRFLSTPSGWRATRGIPRRADRRRISIHALRVEGDGVLRVRVCRQCAFLSTPSGWRATGHEGGDQL